LTPIVPPTEREAQRCLMLQREVKIRRCQTRAGVFAPNPDACTLTYSYAIRIAKDTKCTESITPFAFQ